MTLLEINEEMEKLLAKSREGRKKDPTKLYWSKEESERFEYLYKLKEEYWKRIWDIVKGDKIIGIMEKEEHLK